MDFIIDAIVEWLKGLLVDGIMGNLDGLFIFEHRVKEMQQGDRRQSGPVRMAHRHGLGNKLPKNNLAARCV